MDYAKTYKGVSYFGVWAEETGDTFGARDALDILAQAVERSQDQDLRQDRDTLEALDYLTNRAGRRLAAAQAFRRGLAVSDPLARRHALGEAYKALCRAVNATVIIDL